MHMTERERAKDIFTWPTHLCTDMKCLSKNEDVDLSRTILIQAIYLLPAIFLLMKDPIERIKKTQFGEYTCFQLFLQIS